MAKAANGLLNTAEMAFLIEKFDPAESYRYEQSRQLSITLLKQWLVKYKFRNWKKTKTRQIQVTRKMREERAEQIAQKLKQYRCVAHSCQGDLDAGLTARPEVGN